MPCSRTAASGPEQARVLCLVPAGQDGQAGQEIAQPVVAQAGTTPPAGYVWGSRDGLLYGTTITLTNADNTGVETWTWEVVPPPGLEAVDYGVSGTSGYQLTLTVPSDAPGDLAVRLTVTGAPAAPGVPNAQTTTVLLGLRGASSAYAPGVPIVHPFESSLGGAVTFSPRFGVLGRVSEALRALYEAVKSGAGGGGTLAGDATGPSGSNVVTALRGVPLEEIGRLTTDNFYRLFTRAMPA